MKNLTPTTAIPKDPLAKTLLTYLMGISLLFSIHHVFAAENESSAHNDHDDDAEHEESQLKVTLNTAINAGISLGLSDAATITESIVLFGRTEPDPQRVSHVRARFEGLIKSVIPSLGDRVTAGDRVALVEANNSLKTYSIYAPIDGTVIEKHANKGEIADESSLMTIADYSMLWVSFAVFPHDAAKVKNGQVVNMTADNRKSSSVISFMNSGRGEQASIFARVPLDNSNGDWTPGLFVEAKVIVSETNVALAVSNRAIHEVDGQTVVFTVHNDHGEESFEVTPIRIGKKDNQFTEVVSGLEANTRYAIENSYLLKAELEKSGASHDH